MWVRMYSVTPIELSEKAHGCSTASMPVTPTTTAGQALLVGDDVPRPLSC